MSSHLRGLAYGLTASFLWGTVFVVARYLVDVRLLDPYYMAALRFGVGGLFALGWVWVQLGTEKVLAARSFTWPILALAAVGPCGLGVFVFISAQYTTSINSSLIVNSNAIFIALFALLIGERMNWLRFSGLWIGLVGCGIVIFSAAPEQPLPPSNNLLGGMAALGGAVCWAAYTAFGKGLVRRLGGEVASAWCILGGGLMLAVLAVLQGGVRPLTGLELLAVAYMAIGPTAIAMGLWYKALELVDSSALGPSQYIAPLVSVILGWLLLCEPIGPSFVVGCTVSLLGVYMATRPLKQTVCRNRLCR